MKENKTIPYIAYEASMSREERHIKRLIIALILSIVLAFASNIFWLIAWTQYDYQTEDISSVITASQDGEHNSIKGGDINGEANSND